MTLGRFGDVPVFAFGVLCEYIERGLDNCQHFSLFWREYVLIEEEAARKLQKLLLTVGGKLESGQRRLLPFQQRTTTFGDESLPQAWVRIREEMEKLAAQRLASAQRIRETVAQPLAEFATEKGRKLSKLSSAGRDHILAARKSHEKLSRTKKDYYERRAKAIRSSNALFDFLRVHGPELGRQDTALLQQQCASLDPPVKSDVTVSRLTLPLGEEKLREQRALDDRNKKLAERKEETRKMAEDSMAKYQENVLSTRVLQHALETTQLPELCEEFETLEHERHALFQETLRRAATIIEELPRCLTEQIKQLHAVASAVDGTAAVGAFADAARRPGSIDLDLQTALPTFPIYEPFDGKEGTFYKHLQEQFDANDMEQEALLRVIESDPELYPQRAQRDGGVGLLAGAVVAVDDQALLGPSPLLEAPLPARVESRPESPNTPDAAGFPPPPPPVPDTVASPDDAEEREDEPPEAAGADAMTLLSMLTELQKLSEANDYYVMLGVTVDADTRAVLPQQIQKQRRIVTAALHPDKFNPGEARDSAAKKLEAINEAYTRVFKEERSREIYDILCDYRRSYSHWMYDDVDRLRAITHELTKLRKQLKKLDMPVDLAKEVTKAILFIGAITSIGEG